VTRRADIRVEEEEEVEEVKEAEGRALLVEVRRGEERL